MTISERINARQDIIIGNRANLDGVIYEKRPTGVWKKSGNQGAEMIAFRRKLGAIRNAERLARLSEANVKAQASVVLAHRVVGNGKLTDFLACVARERARGKLKPALTV